MPVQIDWVRRGLVIATVDGRTLYVWGEALLNNDPGYLIYTKSINIWEDGTPLENEEKSKVLEAVIAEAAKRGWIFALDKPSTPPPTRQPTCVRPPQPPEPDHDAHAS